MHMTWETVKVWVMDDDAMIADMINDLADRHKVHTDSIMVTAAEWLPKLEDPVSGLPPCDPIHCTDWILFMSIRIMLPWEIADLQRMATQQNGYPLKSASCPEDL